MVAFSLQQVLECQQYNFWLSTIELK